MAGAIATLLTSSKVVPQSGSDLRAQLRHAYNELTYLQENVNDPELASPYLKASAVTTVGKTVNATEGNFTLTLNFPKYGVAVTTANIAYNADASTIQTAVDNALDGETIVDSYDAGDVDVAVSGNISANAATITANGDTVNGAHMIVTTANVDLDAYEMTVTANTIGTQNRPAEAILTLFGVVNVASDVTPQGMSPSVGDYTDGDNPFSMSPGLIDLLVQEMEMSEDSTIGAFIRGVIGSV